MSELNYIVNELVELPDYSDCEIFPEFSVSHKMLDCSDPPAEIISHCCKERLAILSVPCLPSV